MNVINLPIDELKAYENNPRVISEYAVKAVVRSIREFGFKVPIIVDENRVIIAGHTRLLAAKELGLKEVPCIVANDLTPEQVKAFRLADNKTSELSGWDFDKLDIELEDLKELNLDMSEFGFLMKDDVDMNDFFDDAEPHSKANSGSTGRHIICPECGAEIELKQ